MLCVRLAVSRDAEQVEALLTEASAWLAGRGISWLRDGPGPVPERIARGEVWAVRIQEDGPLIATVSIDEMPDPELWGPQPPDALYVHRLTVTRTHAGHGIGALLLDFAADYTVRAGRTWVRLDTNKSNTRLQAYYAANGFRHVRTVDLPHRVSGALFERKACLSSAVDRVSGRHFHVAMTSL
ncbi:GNAT family N-acetyltransferase [Actinocrinis sp.]|uniref:GNAT family N-acetyltransferase n=1 Tax=Actinocrinis sp. TaxID=1920516 RepID=UPI0032C2211A